MTKQKGFTLIELLIVIAIIAVLATLALVSLTAAQQRSRDTKRVADMKSMQTAMELFYSENASYPGLNSSNTNDTDNIANSWSDLSDIMRSYISALPVPPTNDASTGDVYMYAVENTALDSYILRGSLEDNEHIALDQDPNDTDFGGTTAWALLISDETATSYDHDGDAAASTAAITLTSGVYNSGGSAVTITCADNVANANYYCLLGTASE